MSGTKKSSYHHHHRRSLFVCVGQVALCRACLLAGRMTGSIVIKIDVRHHHRSSGGVVSRTCRDLIQGNHINDNGVVQ